MTADLQRLEELYGKATKGTWSSDPDGDTTPIFSTVGEAIGETYSDMKDTDAALIAALHNAFPSLLARIRELEHDNTVLVDMHVRDADALAAAEARAAAMQGEIDRLMLEHCPDEMTTEQTANWAKHQVPVCEHEYITVGQVSDRPVCHKCGKEE